MTEILVDDFASGYDDSILNSNDGVGDQEANRKTKLEIPSIAAEPTTLTLAKNDSIVIPSVSNGSIASVLQIEANNKNNNNNNSNLLPVCSSNSLGDLSSTPLLLLDNPISNRSIETSTNPVEQNSESYIHSHQSIPTSSSTSSASSSTTPTSDHSRQNSSQHEILKNEMEYDHLITEVSSIPKKGPAPPPPKQPATTTTTMATNAVKTNATTAIPISTVAPVTTNTTIIDSPVSVQPSTTGRTLSQSVVDELHYTTVERISENYPSDHQSRRSLNRQNHQRHGSADVLCQHSNHQEYMNRSSTSSSSFYPNEHILSTSLNYYDYDHSRTYIQQIEEELRQTKEQLNATIKSIKTFWSPELKKERSLRKEESCRYQLLINEHQKRTKQESHIQLLEHQLRQLREELDKSRNQQRHDLSSIPTSHVIPEQPSIDTASAILQRQYQELKEKLEQRTNELHSKDNECVTLKAKVDTYESKEKDLQHYITILKESILIKDQQVNMIQSEMADLRTRLKEKDSIIEKKNSKIQSTRVDRQQRECDLQEAKQQLDIRDRKINVLNRKVENLEEQLREKSNQIASTRAKLTAVTSTATTVPVQQQSSLTTNILVSNLEASLAEKERFIEKLREHKHLLEVEHQEEIDKLQKTLAETRKKLEHKEKDYHEGQNQIIELREQLNNAKSILQRRESQVQSLEQQMNSLKKNRNDSDDRSRLEEENRTLAERLSSMELERIEMKHEIDWMQEEIEKQSLPTTANASDFNEQEQQYQALINKKQERIEELEQAVRESFQITSEREYAMNQQKRKLENLEKQIKTLQNEVEHLRTENNDQSQLLEHLKSELIERKRQYENRLEEQIKQLDNAFISQQEKILGELSEKDSQIGQLEMDRNSSGASNRAIIIERLNTEKQQLHNQLKELTEIRMKIIQDHMAAKQEYERKEKTLPFTGVTD